MKGKLLLAIILLLMSTLRVEAGDSLKIFRRTGIYVELGGPGYIHLNGNIEHYFLNGKLLHLGARAGYGTWGIFDGGSGWEGLLTATALVGKKHSFLEIQAGSILKTNTSEKAEDNKNNSPDYQYLPFASIGYNLRVWHFVFKASVNTASPINAGVGVVF